MGLREEKKQASRTAIADAALRLFLTRGFDRVTVAEVAGEAHVSVNTVFNYFPTKEDLFFDRQAEIVRRLADIVERREPGEPAVTAVRRAFLTRLHENDPTLGLHEGMVHFWRTAEDSPALQARLRLINEQTEAALAESLSRASKAPPGDAFVLAATAAIAGIDRALHTEIRRRLLSGDDPAEIRAALTELAAKAFDTAASGLAGYPQSSPL